MDISVELGLSGKNQDVTGRVSTLPVLSTGNFKAAISKLLEQ